MPAFAFATAHTNSFTAYKVRFKLSLPDPDMPQPRYHTVLFIETQPDGSGTIFHAIGDLVAGMTYNTRPQAPPERDDLYHSKQLVGSVSDLEAVDAICRAQPTPPKQKAFNKQTMRYEPFKADGGFYGPGESRAPLRKCTEWVEEQVIPVLIESGVLVA